MLDVTRGRGKGIRRGKGAVLGHHRLEIGESISPPSLTAAASAAKLPAMFWRALNLLMALLFAFSVVVQYNDPDPIRWMAIYGAAMVVSGLTAWHPLLLPWFAPAIVAVVALVWAATISPRALGRIPLSEMFRSWEMKDSTVEENREMFGLLIVAVWMIVVMIVRLRAGGA
jgi:hypothetical protein